MQALSMPHAVTPRRMELYGGGGGHTVRPNRAGTVKTRQRRVTTEQKWQQEINQLSIIQSIRCGLCINSYYCHGVVPRLCPGGAQVVPRGSQVVPRRCPGGAQLVRKYCCHGVVPRLGGHAVPRRCPGGAQVVYRWCTGCPGGARCAH